MYKKISAIVLSVAILLGSVGVCFAESSITVSLSVSKYGALVTDGDGNPMANAAVSLSGKENYNLDDLFRAAHAQYCPSGAEGYASSDGDWGLSMDKLWDDTSYNFGYQLNGGSVTVTGLSQELSDGDFVDACIYQSLYPDSEDYSVFDQREISLVQGEPCTLALSAVNGYDEMWNPLFAPCEGAVITVNGEDTELVTDADGSAELVFGEVGRYVVSAHKEKELDSETVPAITAPSCIVTVTEPEFLSMIHAIAKNYVESELTTNENLPWITADLMVYESLFPDSGIALDDAQKEAMRDVLIAAAEESDRAGDLAKTILALRALGYDAHFVSAESDPVQKLTELVDSKDRAATNIYTLPYVLIALSQADGYATEAQISYLLGAALRSADSWQDTTEGTDALTPMLLALAPYYKKNSEVKSALDAAVSALKATQRDDGMISGFPGYEGASTGLAICGLSALSVDAAAVTKNGNSLIDGLMLDANEAKDGFSNPFATEQGFRGLLAWRLMAENKRMYDFSEAPMEILVSVPKENKEKKSHGSSGGGGTAIGAGAASSAESSVAEKVPTENPEAKETVGGGFPDVKETDWFYDAVQYVSEKGLFQGTPQGFDPNGKMTRAMLVTVLHRLDGAPQSESPLPFSDVFGEDWYADGVRWAAQNKIVSGISELCFAPELPVTREQLAAILYRYAQYRNFSTEQNTDLSVFEDAKSISDYARDALSYACAVGLLKGRSETRLAPADTATRAEVATILKRFTED